MNASYYTFRIRIRDKKHVEGEARDPKRGLRGESYGDFKYTASVAKKLQEPLAKASEGELTGPDIVELGDQLFNILFEGDVRNDFFKCYEDARQENALLRVELDIDVGRIPEIASIPWEFLHVPSVSGYPTEWLGTDPAIVFSRRWIQKQTPLSVRLGPQERLRIALAVANPEGLGPVKYQEILESIQELSQTAQIELLEPEIPATKESIDRLLQQRPHILHFIGHAQFLDEDAQEKGQIALVNAMGRPDWVDADNFSTLFRRHQPGVVLLQACESGKLSSSQAFVGVASHVVQQSIPVVVAMQYQVKNMIARRFALEFYKRLADGEPVDKAAQEGRWKIAIGPQGYESRDFAIPVIFIHVSDVNIFERQLEGTTKGEVADLEQPTGTSQEARSVSQEPAAQVGEADWPGEQKKIVRQLMLRKDEIKPTHRSVAKRINQLKNPEEDEILLDAIYDFLDDELSADDFIKEWQDLQTSSASSSKQAGDIDYEALAGRLKHGSLVPVIGPEIYSRSKLPSPSLPSVSELVHKLAEKAQYGEFSGPLSKISQYYQIQPQYGRDSLVTNLQEEIESPTNVPPPHPLYQLLSQISEPILIISVSYDRYLERHFTWSGKRFVTISHVRQDNNFSQFELDFSDKSELEIHTLESISPLKLMENNYSIIYEACGYLGNKSSGSIVDTESMIISEEDYFAFARQIDKIIPDYLVKKIGSRSLLFLGAPIDDWEDRLVVNALLEKNPSKHASSCVVQEEPDDYESAYWAAKSLTLYQMDLPNFIKNLSPFVN